MVKKQGGKIACGECKKYFEEDKLIADPKNNRYLCDGCYEPRDNDREPDNECQECGELVANCECDKEEIEDNGDDIECENSPRAIRGETRIKREARERTPKEKSKLISW